MPERDGGRWPFPHQALLAGILAVLTAVLLTAMGDEGRRPSGTGAGVIEASLGQVPTTSPAPVPVAGPAPALAAVVEGPSGQDAGAAVAVPPANSSSSAPGPAVATTATTVPAAAAPSETSAGDTPAGPPPTAGQPAGQSANTSSTSTTAAPPPSTTSTSTSTTVVAALAAAGPVRTPGVEAEVVPLTNADRTAQGLTALSRLPCLDSAASRFAEQLAATGVLAHNPGAGSAATGCRPGEAWGDNVGTATPCSASLLEQKWMASASHRRNILTPAFRYIGVGAWTDAAGACWVQVLFSS